MLLSTSSSERLPDFDGERILPVVFLAFVICVVALELVLMVRGVRPGVVDSEELWRKERFRASELGAKGLVLIGASRGQLGWSLDVLQRRLDLTPVQLAIDGSSFWPVLRSLADDSRIVGTVVVDVPEHLLTQRYEPDAAFQFVSRYSERPYEAKWEYQSVEAELSGLVRGALRSYADGTRPVTAFIQRGLRTDYLPQYLVTRPDRSRRADYELVPMPGFYYSRVLRTMPAPVRYDPAWTWSQLDGAIRSQISSIEPRPSHGLAASLKELVELVGKIERRGGHVIFVRLPSSGLVYQIEQRLFPRNVFWRAIESNFPGRTVHFADYKTLSRYECPDGSHLDWRYASSFTEDFVSVIDWSRRRAVVSGGASGN